MPKKIERGDPLGFFNTHSVAKHQKIEGDPFGEFFSEKNSRNAEKTERETLWSPLILYVTGETFLVQFLGPTGTI